MSSGEISEVPDSRAIADQALQALVEARSAGTPVPDGLGDLRGVRWIGQDFSGLDLSGIDFSGADLSRTRLAGCRLIGTRFDGAKLFQADLEGAECLSASFRETDMSECKATGAGFGAADMSSVRLFRAELSEATFTQARLPGADARGATLCRARLREVDLTGADLSRADLSNADLDKGIVKNAQFVDSDLHGARLRGVVGYSSTNWIEANITAVDFCGAYLVRRTIMDQNYLHEFRTFSKFNRLLYWAWWASSDCGRSFLRWGLWTAFLAVVYAGLYEGVSVDYGSHPTFLSSLYYSVVTLTTLGYGDVLPASAAAQVMAMSEVILGYVMLGGLLSIFSNKMARRAD